MNSSKNKQEGGMIGAIVKFVIVWLWWWVAMPMVLHQWIYKSCCSWNLKRSEQKAQQSFSCFNVRLQHKAARGWGFLVYLLPMKADAKRLKRDHQLRAISFARSRPLIPTKVCLNHYNIINASWAQLLRLSHAPHTRYNTTNKLNAMCNMLADWLLGFW